MVKQFHLLMKSLYLRFQQYIHHKKQLVHRYFLDEQLLRKRTHYFRPTQLYLWNLLRPFEQSIQLRA